MKSAAASRAGGLGAGIASAARAASRRCGPRRAFWADVWRSFVTGYRWCCNARPDPYPLTPILKALAAVFRGKLLAALNAQGLTLPVCLPERWCYDPR